MSFSRIILIFAALCGAFTTAHADIYQFVDENGVVHFTNVSGGRVKSPTKVHKEPRGTATENRTVAAAQASGSAVRRSGDDIPASYLPIINSACARYGVDPSLVHAIVKVESDFNPYAVSRKGAMGLMQLMPETALILNVKDSFSPHENIEGGVRYLRYLLDRYEGNLSLTLAAYNSGETSVKKWGTIPPSKETQDYVKKILNLYNGTGSRPLAPRYTIYVGTSADGTIMLTDNPSNHPGKKLHRRMDQSL